MWCSCKKQENTLVENPLEIITPATRDAHLVLGNPSNATTSSSNPDNYLIERAQYVLSYNSSKGIPNWVCWHLSKAWLGSVPRCDCFMIDNLLPTNFTLVGEDDYLGSGFDRGHLCPSGDRDSLSGDNATTFYMTNMIPQAPDLNQKVWVDFENYCRVLVEEGNELFISAGGYGVGGEGSLGYKTDIKASSGNNIVVPSNMWKVVVVLSNGGDDKHRVASGTRVIAIDIPNNQQADDKDWKQYRVSVDWLEGKTGFNFLNLLDQEIQNEIESMVDVE